MIWQHPFLLISIVCCAPWILGCSSKDKGTKQEQKSESADPNNESKADPNIPDPTEIKPEIYGSTANSNIILRDSKGNWVSKETGDLYSGTVVFELAGNVWEEKFKDGVKISMRGWDKEKNPIELYSWNMDGTKKTNPQAIPVKLGE